jgi:hypothetical protein
VPAPPRRAGGDVGGDGGPAPGPGDSPLHPSGPLALLPAAGVQPGDRSVRREVRAGCRTGCSAPAGRGHATPESAVCDRQFIAVVPRASRPSGGRRGGSRAWPWYPHRLSAPGGRGGVAWPRHLQGGARHRRRWRTAAAPVGAGQHLGKGAGASRRLARVTSPAACLTIPTRARLPTPRPFRPAVLPAPAALGVALPLARRTRRPDTYSEHPQAVTVSDPITVAPKHPSGFALQAFGVGVSLCRDWLGRVARPGYATE